jgi:uncharacterized protein (TIGR02285 family)
MLKKTIVLFFILTISIFAEKKVINWYKIDIPPFYIMTGDLKGKGVGDEIQKLFEKEFLDYENKTVYASEVRRAKNIENNENYITFQTIIENGKKPVLFSLPIMVAKNMELIYKKSNEHKFKNYINSSGEIEIDKLLERESIVIGYNKGRHFPVELTKTMNKKENIGKLKPLISQNASEGNIKKLEMDRVDCIIESGLVVEYTKKLNNLKLNYVKIKIKGVPEHVYVYAVFSNNEFGKKAQKRINKFLEKKCMMISI